MRDKQREARRLSRSRTIPNFYASGKTHTPREAARFWKTTLNLRVFISNIPICTYYCILTVVSNFLFWTLIFMSASGPCVRALPEFQLQGFTLYILYVQYCTVHYE